MYTNKYMSLNTCTCNDTYMVYAVSPLLILFLLIHHHPLLLHHEVPSLLALFQMASFEIYMYLDM